MELSVDQQNCLSKLKSFLRMSGVCLDTANHKKASAVKFKENMIAVLGYAGSGKTELLRLLVELLEKSEIQSANIDYEAKLKDEVRC